MWQSIDSGKLSKKENYQLLTSAVLPRPIAFVTSLAEDGTLNAAPFSFFNVLSAQPPLLSVSVGRRGDSQKDTARNILEQGEFVVHITDEKNAEAMNETAASLAPDESEAEKAGLTPVESTAVKVPGLKESRIRLECKLEQHLVFEEGDTKTDLIIGRVLHYHLADEVLKDGKIDVHQLSPVARLGGRDYTKLGEVFSLDRPD
ncbi:flavin reductase family protein [Evansella sp. LMS18]|jgi:flavin reductase (DIM6/NTAB) family NADH-FMN oxidoreductase RutF|uniref:flavin reductase family protein n=1 Tax=Evansella sp. LMS18 TaxID=2924033 RepID=UPI0020D0A0C0|nr:flavin reductase family protein [Evansella sp. LMS18]UTR08895.1 flavin reductase family protein [Evansella sp. LMS18]